MEFNVSKESVCINKLIAKKKDIIFVEEDMIVPDSKPDILSTVNSSGNVCIYKKEVLDDRVKIEGCVNTYIMYISDSDGNYLRGLNAIVDFSESVQVPGVKEGMSVIVNVSIKDLECKVLNGRKINIRAGLEINVSVYSNEDVEMISNINNIESIQTLEKSYEINSLFGSGSTRIYVKDTLNIEGQDELVEVLKTEIDLVDQDIKLSYNKILTKCEVEVKIMYLTKDNRINTVTGKIPAVGFIDMVNVSENNICDLNNEIKNIIIRPNSVEEHSIYIEIELETICMTYEKKSITLIQDLYSPIIDLEFSQKNVTAISDKISKNKNLTVTSKTNISNLIDGNLLDVEVATQINKEQVMVSKIMYDGELVLNFIYLNENSSINSKIAKIPFEFSIDNPLMNDLINVNTKTLINGKKFDIRSGGDIECNIDIEFILECSRNISLNIIDNIQAIENREIINEYDSLIIYVTVPGDTLWKIAKKFKSTVDDIVTLNEIENRDKIEVGQKLYIPKFNCRNM